MINLGDKNWGVKDSGLLAYKQVGSRFFNKDFDFTRASNGTYVDKDGVLQTAELYNLFEYSENFEDNFYQLGSNSTLSLVDDINPNGFEGCYRLENPATSATYLATRSLGTITNDSIFSIYVKSNTNSNQNFGLYYVDGGATGYTTQCTATSEWQRFNIPITQTFIQVGINNESDAYANDILIWGAQLVEGTEPRDYQYTNGRVGIPRIDFSDGVGALLLEPQRSNLLLQSNSFNTTWVTSSASVTSGQDGIYGTNDAWLLTKSGANGRVDQNVSSSGVQSISIYAKANTKNWIALRVDVPPAAKYGYFDLSNGTTGAADAGFNTSIEDVGNGWYRCTAWFNFSITVVRIYVADGNQVLTGTSGSIYIQHAQLESGSYPTSTIETTTSQVTRIADVANNCGTEQDFNSEEGVLYVEAIGLADGDSIRQLSLNDNSVNNYVFLRYSNTSGRFQGFVRSGGGTVDSLSSVGNVQTDNNKIALVYKASEFSMWLNGTKVDTITPTAMPIGLNQFDFDLSGANNFYGKVKNLQVFNEALTDAELQKLTT